MKGRREGTRWTACQEIGSDSSSGSWPFRSPGGSRTREKLDLERALDLGRAAPRAALIRGSVRTRRSQLRLYLQHRVARLAGSNRSHRTTLFPKIPFIYYSRLRVCAFLSARRAERWHDSRCALLAFVISNVKKVSLGSSDRSDGGRTNAKG